jgi:two-component system NtrC family sensor kinase
VSFHDITVHKAYKESAAARGNPDEVLHLLVNLITNAVQAMEQGGGTLTLATEQSAGAVTLQITDTGCGIGPAVLQQLFEPFFTTKAPGKGTGLGLYNVKTIVSKMRGKIDVESGVGKGTTFRIRFPSVTENET